MQTKLLNKFAHQIGHNQERREQLTNPTACNMGESTQRHRHALVTSDQAQGEQMGREAKHRSVLCARVLRAARLTDTQRWSCRLCPSASGWVGPQRGPATRQARQEGLGPLPQRGWTSRTLGL